ncbi:MAG: hypothetical protein K6C36_03795 [Clostridia bacterium]|nr:hypothetical protein [Clostridia bacterium]
MKLIKKAAALLCVFAVIAGAAAYVLLRPTAMPAARELLYEDAPPENGLRSALEVDGIGGSRFFIQSPKRQALQTVGV